MAMAIATMVNGGEGVAGESKNGAPRMRGFFRWWWCGKVGDEAATAATLAAREASGGDENGGSVTL